ncbi:2-iminobutanoate/2-iminopropanoate deaminase [Keratinibaculum paraultunense]|uniref:2-iminobutanoate/2-iminopropanoate deaminase n=1 Tax=Keratinibaculum paraultunense TaxID=1278232 RepID=A0A4R3L0R9_9FIRM|nr:MULTISPECIES: RidA family protein [Bacillota]MBU5455469.1 RidA family protein [Caproiciproducens sp. MSJ-32]QQY80439.1 RidA family protein [Keratinibaculum paraultunense]TCS91157.1 2-iminobutanoate/2-iminopropanoate deaminase [Keratinibaculum paraultunense]
MNIVPINTNKAPGAVGPYSQGIKAGNLIFTSGQLPIVPETGELLKDDIKEETRQCLKNVEAILKEVGATLKNVVKVNIYIVDMDMFSSINEAYEEYFNEHKPARSCIEVSRLPKDGNIEIEVIAVL